MTPQRLTTLLLVAVNFALIVGAPLYISRNDAYDQCIQRQKSLYRDGEEDWFRGLRAAEKLHSHGPHYYALRDVTYHKRQQNINEVNAIKC